MFCCLFGWLRVREFFFSGIVRDGVCIRFYAGFSGRFFCCLGFYEFYIESGFRIIGRLGWGSSTRSYVGFCFRDRVFGRLVLIKIENVSVESYKIFLWFEKSFNELDFF